MTVVVCPFCKKQPAAAKPIWPFCSERCKQGDLGKWASGSYAIPGQHVDLEEGAPETVTGGSDREDEASD